MINLKLPVIGVIGGTFGAQADSLELAEKVGAKIVEYGMSNFDRRDC